MELIAQPQIACADSLSRQRSRVDIFFFIVDKLRAACPSALRSVRRYRDAKPKAYPDMLTTSGKLLPEPTEVVVAGAGRWLVLGCDSNLLVVSNRQ